ncbi:hypothetical protein BU23DRAFT_565868 [Bimuria novae-zelandiae CBS 107.79]|uniref:Uncharacterized protein n=1 Tax=Bimuria novae-zelandiae CBS 107.79 TaxID=1447943 RepID=A0A6A5VSE6_9PLEO|nr:hypothetical protein BU23DRAFT_565868 [Bimuria novae-zelandiae CBS 107.79]
MQSFIILALAGASVAAPWGILGNWGFGNLEVREPEAYHVAPRYYGTGGPTGTSVPVPTGTSTGTAVYYARAIVTPEAKINRRGLQIDYKLAPRWGGYVNDAEEDVEKRHYYPSGTAFPTGTGYPAVWPTSPPSPTGY